METSSPKSRPTLETERLVLRPFDPSDASRVQLLAGDRAVAATTKNIPHPYEDGMAEQWIGTHQIRFEKGQEVVFAITRRGGGELIGAIGLILNLAQENAEMGYWIGKPYWVTATARKPGMPCCDTPSPNSTFIASMRTT